MYIDIIYYIRYLQYKNQRWSRGHKARGQGQGHKKIRGQGQGQPFRGQTLSRPRPRTKDTTASALQKKGLHKNFSGDLQKKKKSSQNFFKRSPQKNVF